MRGIRGGGTARVYVFLNQKNDDSTGIAESDTMGAYLAFNRPHWPLRLTSGMAGDVGENGVSRSAISGAVTVSGQGSVWGRWEAPHPL